MIKIGLTGTIGSGKSSVSKQLQILGFKVIDADEIVKKVYKFYPEVNKDIKMILGKKFFSEDNTLDRKKLGNYIFANKDKRLLLESIVIPYVKLEISNELEKNRNEIFCILDAPTLIENNLHKDMDYNVIVYSTVQNIKKRLVSRDDLSEEEIENRLKAQLPYEEKKKYVDYIINNNGSKKDLEREVDKFKKHITLYFSKGGI